MMRAGSRRIATVAALAGLVLACAVGVPAQAAPVPTRPAGPVAAQPRVERSLALGDGSTVTLDSTGTARHLDAHGRVLAQQQVPVPQVPLALGSALPTDDTLRGLFSTRPGPSSGRVVAVLARAVLTGAPRVGRPEPGSRTPVTSDARVNQALHAVHAASIHPLLSGLSQSERAGLQAASTAQLGSGALDLSRAVVVDVPGQDPDVAAATLRATPGISFAEPDRYVSPMNTGGQPLPATGGSARPSIAASAAGPGLPSNYGLTSSLQSYLNAGGVNAVGAYSDLTSRYGQLPGTGEIITNVSIGDLTDQAMADAGDGYVAAYGPTTVVRGGQRYLDLPSMPLIPTYTAASDGSLDPTGSTEGQDPTLGEVLLDFGVMAPLPHDRQRPDALGSGDTDLLGIAPGAQYRLVVPQQPTFDQVAVAMLAAARQVPRPDVITASLGFGTDSAGFPGRYLEDDPLQQAVVAAIVRDYHIVVCISSNDGTRLYTPASIGPDGGSTPTDLATDAGGTTSIADDAWSTTPSLVRDSGAIAVGGTTLDDTLAAPPAGGGALSRTATFAATRTDGGGGFSSGFGTRVNVSAPSDGIAVFEHAQRGSAQSVVAVLNGGTSASAPMTAAAAAVVLQAGRLRGRALTPAEVRSTLERTGRPVASPPQADRPVTVGPQIDVTAAVESVLGAAPRPTGGQPATLGPRIVRLSVAHRVTVGRLGAAFTEASDPDRIDLSGGPAEAGGVGGAGGTGEGLVGPVTFGLDLTGALPARHLTYRLVVGHTTVDSGTPSIRVTPTELLTAAGLPVASSVDRTVPVTLEVREGAAVVASVDRILVIGPSDGSYAEAQAPIVAPVVTPGHDVVVRYDLTGVRSLRDPQLVVSSIGHWNPATAPLFSAVWTAPLSAGAGTVTVPASAFAGGGGIYGVGIAQQSAGPGPFGVTSYGEFAAVRLAGGSPASRPPAPTLAVSPGGPFGHLARVTVAESGFSVHYDVSQVAGAAGAAIEISAPAPTLFNSLNTFTNANGTTRDADGIDAGSVAYHPVAGTSGTVSLDAGALGLTDADSYDVRVLATDAAGAVVGQGSATSLLTFDDGRAPGQGIDSFAVAAGSPSYAVVRDANGAPSVRPYTPATGGYGPAVTAAADPADDYDLLGTDPAAHRLLLRHDVAAGSTSYLETFDTATGDRVGAVPLAGADYTLIGGRVDPVRHRAAVLARRVADGTDVVLPVDLLSGTAGEPIDADQNGTPARTFGLVTLDESTGKVYLTRVNTSLICFRGGVVAAVDLGDRTVTTAGGPGCVNAVDADSSSHTVYALSYRSFSLNIAGTSTLLPVDGATLATGTALAVRQQPSQTLAVDPIHRLALVAFLTPPTTPHFGNANGLLFDNNATSQLAEVDLTTGALVRNLGGFAFNTSAFYRAPGGSTERKVQLDPATRTGWTYSPDGVQLQRFRY